VCCEHSFCGKFEIQCFGKSLLSSKLIDAAFHAHNAPRAEDGQVDLAPEQRVLRHLVPGPANERTAEEIV
jgi:hypothetical protein